MRFRPPLPRMILVAVAGVGLTLLCGCTSNSSAAGGPVTSAGDSAGSSSPTTPDSPSASAPTSTAPSSTSARPSATSTHPSASATPTAPTSVAPVDTHLPRCTAAELRVSALRGSGAQQQQYATVYVTAIGPRACWLVGYASVSLRLGTAALGAAATPAGTAQPAYLLARAKTAQALVHGPSTCEAAVSDTMWISAPGTTTVTDAAVPMRGCPLIVDAFAPSTPH